MKKGQYSNSIALFVLLAMTAPFSAVAKDESLAQITVKCSADLASFTIIQRWGEVGYFDCGSGTLQGLKAERGTDGLLVSLVGSSRPGQHLDSTGEKNSFKVLESLTLSEGVSGSLGNGYIDVVAAPISADREALRQLIESDKRNTRMEAERRGLKIAEFSQKTDA